MTTLTLFDLDGTLSHRDTGDLLPGVLRHFTLTPPDRWCIVTNQGGVGLRRWMERHGFGEPDRYPTAADIDATLSKVVDAIGKLPLNVYVCYAYQARSGDWAPTPPEGEGDPSWNPDWRKPSPGMLLQACVDAGVSPADALMVGDSDADYEAAKAAGIPFRWADEFFGRVYALRPSDPRTPLAVALSTKDTIVYAQTPRFLDGLGDVLKGLRYRWDEVKRRWYRELTTRHGDPADRLIETAVHLLAARFPVTVPTEDLRNRIATRDYTPEQTRWLLASVKGNRAGQLVAEWGKTESFSRHLYRIPGVKVYEQRAYFPAELWDVALDFAQTHQFSISDPAQRLIADARTAYESAYVVDVEPLPAVAQRPAGRPELPAEEFGVDEDLLDDLADDD